jgi:hypothetical protein
VERLAVIAPQELRHVKQSIATIEAESTAFIACLRERHAYQERF